MKKIMTIRQLKKKARNLRDSKFNKGEKILFCVDYGLYCSSHINSELFSTARKALKFAKSFDEKDYIHVYPCFDIWNNPKQVDRR